MDSIELNQNKPRVHLHDFERKDNYDVCRICGLKRLFLERKDNEERSFGVRKDGKIYTVRDNRMDWFYPKDWVNVYNNIVGFKAKLTCDLLIRTGARINEIRNINQDDIDLERNNLRLRITKTKARKGEKRGKPRTLPMDQSFLKKLNKIFTDGQFKILSTSAFNTSLKKACDKSGLQGYKYSAHSIRKTHGNWLKILGNIGLLKVDATEICLRLGHDYNTYLSAYGSSSVLSNEDILIAKKILGDLYSR